MTNSSLKERLGRLERTPGVPRILSGSAVTVDLLPPERLPDLKTIPAVQSLARRGVRLALAKAVIEDLVRQPPQPASVHVPHVEDRDTFAREMAASGVRVAFCEPPAAAAE